MTRFLMILFSLMCASLTVSSACFAEPGSQVREVRYDDLNLSTASGMRTLQDRIETAANQVCLDPTGPSPASTVDPGCKADALRNARPQVDRAVAEQRVGGPAVAIAIRRTAPTPAQN